MLIFKSFITNCINNITMIAGIDNPIYVKSCSVGIKCIKQIENANK